jgi:hypothetical protein
MRPCEPGAAWTPEVIRRDRNRDWSGDEVCGDRDVVGEWLGAVRWRTSATARLPGIAQRAPSVTHCGCSDTDHGIVPARAMQPNYAHPLMDRLCERPGCSDNAAVAYGMRTEDLVFWLDVLRESTSTVGGVLCQRHGDSMVVPRGWTLDDLRDPELHLFRPPSRAERGSRRTRRRAGPHAVDDSEQLALGGLIAPEHDNAEPTTNSPEVVGAITAPDIAPEPAADDRVTAAEPDGAADDQWTPSFDDADDLDGLLLARSPLLSRAFRGTGRPD